MAQPFGSDVDQMVSPIHDALEAAGLLGGGDGAVDGRGGDASAGQAIHLVFHQGDEGGDDQGGAGEETGGQLVDEGLAGAGGHHHQSMASGQEMLESLLLAGTESFKAEVLSQGGEERKVGWHGRASSNPNDQIPNPNWS